jgi:nucleoside-diphosphate-sugar epimerase
MNKLKNKTILISGANGFLPSHLVIALLRKEAKVIALCRNEKRAMERFAHILGNENFRIIVQDVCEPIHADCQVDYCIHAASPAGIRSRHEYPVNTFDANVIGCKNLLDIKPQRFMLISSVDVYGNVYKGERLAENDIGYLDILNVRNAYSLGKRAAETLSALYNAQYGVETVIARPFQVYGPGMTIGDGRLHGDFIAQIQSTGKIVLKSDGTAKRSFMYIDDAVDAMITVLVKGENSNAYNIVDEAGELTVLELAELYAKLSRQDVKVEFDHSQRGTAEVTSALPCVLGSSEKLRGLKWEPQTSLSDGIQKTLAYYGL